MGQIKEYLENAETQIHSLNYLFVQFKATDNLTQIQAFKQRVRIIVAIVFVFALIMVVGSALTLAQSILKPLSILQKGVGYFGAGDLTHRIQLHTKDELEHLAYAINDMANKLEQSQRELTEMATIDGLTGVFNRREFNRRLKVELERSRREGHSVSLLMVDIDHFKKLNDTYGHQSGDDALRYVSKLLKREVRPGDQPARYGGEEFAVILPYADSNDVFIVAERIRILLAAQDIPIQDNQRVRVTASLGGATFPSDAQSEETLMAAADEALYRAKHGGRNRVCLANPILTPSPTPVTPTVETAAPQALPLPMSQQSSR
ncbi:MAG: diguanylate cyclase [Thermosynechococcaceae cyanobacterium]